MRKILFIMLILLITTLAAKEKTKLYIAPIADKEGIFDASLHSKAVQYFNGHMLSKDTYVTILHAEKHKATSEENASDKEEQTEQKKCDKNCLLMRAKEKEADEMLHISVSSFGDTVTMVAEVINIESGNPERGKAITISKKADSLKEGMDQIATLFKKNKQEKKQIAVSKPIVKQDDTAKEKTVKKKKIEKSPEMFPQKVFKKKIKPYFGISMASFAFTAAAVISAVWYNHEAGEKFDNYKSLTTLSRIAEEGIKTEKQKKQYIAKADTAYDQGKDAIENRKISLIGAGIFAAAGIYLFTIEKTILVDENGERIKRRSNTNLSIAPFQDGAYVSLQFDF